MQRGDDTLEREADERDRKCLHTQFGKYHWADEWTIHG